jgi:hypothetical protein
MSDTKDHERTAGSEKTGSRNEPLSPDPVLDHRYRRISATMETQPREAAGRTGWCQSRRTLNAAMRRTTPSQAE